MRAFSHDPKSQIPSSKSQIPTNQRLVIWVLGFGFWDLGFSGSLRVVNSNRREFFQFLAASTVLTPSVRAWAQQLAVSHEPPVLMSAKDALQVMDFEEAARRALPPAHWGYMASGSDDDLTLKANVEGFTHVRLKPRRLVDVSKPDLSHRGVRRPVGDAAVYLSRRRTACVSRRGRDGDRARRESEAPHDDPVQRLDLLGRGRGEDARNAALAAALHAAEVGGHREDGEAD